LCLPLPRCWASCSAPSQTYEKNPTNHMHSLCNIRCGGVNPIKSAFLMVHRCTSALCTGAHVHHTSTAQLQCALGFRFRPYEHPKNVSRQNATSTLPMMLFAPVDGSSMICHGCQVELSQFSQLIWHCGRVQCRHQCPAPPNQFSYRSALGSLLT
jgi:hypothetical protein